MGAEEHPEELPTALLLSDMTVLIPEAPPMTFWPHVGLTRPGEAGGSSNYVFPAPTDATGRE